MASRFPLCGMDEETLDHLCLLCPRINGLWQGLFSFSTKSMFNPVSIRVCLRTGSLSPLGRWKLEFGRLPPYACFGEFGERNKGIFNDEDFSLERVKSSFLLSLHSWASKC